MPEPVYRGEFSSVADIEREFEEKLPEEIEILYAEYEQGGYEGDAFVLFRQNGKLYQVSAGHCSCNGLEGMWVPEETSKAALEWVFDKGTRYQRYDFAALEQVVSALE